MGALMIAVAGCVVAVFSWRWSVPANASFYKMVMTKDPAPGSWTYRSLQLNRWFGTVFGVFVALSGLDLFISSL